MANNGESDALDMWKIFSISYVTSYISLVLFWLSPSYLYHSQGLENMKSKNMYEL